MGENVRGRKLGVPGSPASGHRGGAVAGQGTRVYFFRNSASAALNSSSREAPALNPPSPIWKKSQKLAASLSMGTSANGSLHCLATLGSKWRQLRHACSSAPQSGQVSRRPTWLPTISSFLPKFPQPAMIVSPSQNTTDRALFRALRVVPLVSLLALLLPP